MHISCMNLCIDQLFIIVGIQNLQMKKLPAAVLEYFEIVASMLILANAL